MMCMYEEAMTSKRVTLESLDAESFVESDSQCRACFDVNKPNKVSDLQRHLLDNGCIAQSDTCRYVCIHVSYATVEVLKGTTPHGYWVNQLSTHPLP